VAVLRQAWQRYGRPVAITEAHLGCTREEQLRWLLEVWDGLSRILDDDGRSSTRTRRQIPGN
jgi:dTDP-4-dehydrorhamnose reductase